MEKPVNQDIQTEFELDKTAGTTLGGIKNKGKTNREKVTAASIKHTSFKCTLDRVQYGTYDSAPACLIEFDFWFHFENTSKSRLRCTTAFIEIVFTQTTDSNFTPPATAAPDDDPAVVLFGPAKVWGLTKSVTEKQTHLVMLPFLIKSTGVDMGVQYVNTRESELEVDHRMNIQGSTVGDAEHSRDNIVRWKLDENEAQKDGIVHQFRAVVVVLLPPGGRMKAKVTVKPTVKFSLNPARWLLKQTSDDPVYLDGVTNKGRALDGLVDFHDPGFDWTQSIKIPTEYQVQLQTKRPSPRCVCADSRDRPKPYATNPGHL